jgi:cell division septum initiation protein DivIVA
MVRMNDSSAFRTIWRGYEPAQVDRTVQELAGAVRAAQEEAERLRSRVAALEAAAAASHPSADSPAGTANQDPPPAPPTFEQLGNRVGDILALAEEVAAERVSAAEADAGRLLDDAHRVAAEVLDAAEREAAARREEAEAVHERQRAVAAQAAADFEDAHAQRRLRAEEDFAARSAAAEQQLAAVHAQADRARAEAERVRAQAEQDAEQLLLAAKARADQVAAESDRRMTAAEQRRASIDVQLVALQQTLATLTGSFDPGRHPSDAPLDLRDENLSEELVRRPS